MGREWINNNQMRKWWTRATNKVYRMMWTGEMSPKNRSEGGLLQDIYTTRKCLQKSRVGRTLTPLLENSDDWIPFWSVCSVIHMGWRGHRRNSMPRSFPCSVVLERRGVQRNWRIFKNHLLQVQIRSLLLWIKLVKGGRRSIWLNRSLLTEMKHKKRHARGGSKDRWCKEYRDNKCAGIGSGKPKPIGS